MCDLRVVGATVHSVPQLTAGFGPGWAPEDAPGVRPLQVQEHQHVLKYIRPFIIYILNALEEMKQHRELAALYRWQDSEL